MFKRKLFKKNVALALSLVLAMGTLGACGNSNSKETSTTEATTSSSKSSTESAEQTSDSGEVETLKVMIWDRGTAAAGTTMEDNPLVTWIKEQVLENCNVDVSYVTVPRSDSDEKLNVMMAGGNAPDIVFTYDQSIYTNYATNGGLADLTEAYANYGSQIQDVSGSIQYMGEYEDTQYAIMKQRQGSVSRHVSYIRADWLETLGMDVPTTKDELFEILYAFKEQNPGNATNIVPWAMGGVTNSEKYYLNFVGSYVEPLEEREAYIYSEAYKIFADGAIDGIRKLNELYNDGIISKDFVTDTSDDTFKQDVSNGNAGFFLSNTSDPAFECFKVLKANDENADFIPLTCFDLPDGSYCSPAEPEYGMFIMVPKASESKVNAAVKYLNWMVNPKVSEMISYTPDHVTSDNGIPIRMTLDELAVFGYPGTPADYCIMNDKFEFATTSEGVINSLADDNPWETKDYFENAYKVFYEDGHYVYPTFSAVITAETEYGANVKTLAVEYVYKLICAAPGEFDNLQAAEYGKLVTAGLEKVLEERAEYYDNNIANQ